MTPRKWLTQGWVPGAVIGAALVGLLWYTSVHRTLPPDPGPAAPVQASPPQPQVTRLVIRTAEGVIIGRTPPDTFVMLPSPVSLSLEATAQPDKVEFFEFYGGPVTGNEYGPQPRRIGETDGGRPLEWTIRPGKKAQLYGVAWYGNVGVRSPSLYMGRPMPDETQCPDVSFPRLRPIAHAQVSLIVDSDMNLIQIVTPREVLDFSLKVDPKTCKDDQVRHWLEQAHVPG